MMSYKIEFSSTADLAKAAKGALTKRLEEDVIDAVVDELGDKIITKVTKTVASDSDFVEELAEKIRKRFLDEEELIDMITDGGNMHHILGHEVIDKMTDLVRYQLQTTMCKSLGLPAPPAPRSLRPAPKSTSTVKKTTIRKKATRKKAARKRGRR